MFCATQFHAAAIRNLINQLADSKNINYCVRVTAHDGKQGDEYLNQFQDNEKTIPTILTTSQKLSTGVDARNVRNIVLLRPVKSMIEFKQIIGRGTRLYEGKEYFTVYDFVDAYHHFSDPEWDGEPIEPSEPSEPTAPRDPREPKEPQPPTIPDESKQKLVIKLRDGKEREIQHMMSTSFWGNDGKPLSSEEFIKNLYGDLPSYFKDEQELKDIWANPKTRKSLLDKLADAGYGKVELQELQKLVDAVNSDLFDVLEYISFNIKPIARIDRVEKTSSTILNPLSIKEKEFIEFVLTKYIDSGFGELNEDKIPQLLELQYGSINDATNTLGGVERIREVFFNFQKDLYQLELT